MAIFGTEIKENLITCFRFIQQYTK